MSLPQIEPYPMPRRDELPDNVVGWRVDPARAVVLVHDMQHYFLSAFPSGRAPGRDLLDNASALVAGARSAGVPVAYSVQPGDMTATERGLLKDFWGDGMTAGPGDRDVVAEVAPDDTSTVFTKWRYSAFHRNGLLEHLRETGRDQLVLCGVYAHVGCLMTAVEAFTNDIETFLVADAIADFARHHHEMALEYAAARCAVVIPTEDVLTGLAAGCRVTAGSSS